MDAGELADSIDDHRIPCYPKQSHPLRLPALGPAVSSCASEVTAPRRGAERGLSRRGSGQDGPRGRMDLFVSNFTLRLDAKGRVSIPASYRNVLKRDGFDGLYVYPSLDRPALDAGGHALLRDIEKLIHRFAPFSDDREDLEAALYGTSETLKVDGEGRVS